MGKSQADLAQPDRGAEIARLWVTQAERKLAEGKTLSEEDQIAYFAGLLGSSATRQEQRYGHAG